MKKNKIFRVITIVIVVIVCVCGVSFLSALANYKKKIEAIQVQNVDLSTIEDGEYFGSCDVGFVSARVRIVMKDHVIEELELLEHNNGRGAAAEALPSTMLAEQRIDVDVVSGATASSKVIQEAVYNALTGR